MICAMYEHGFEVMRERLYMKTGTQRGKGA